MAFDPTSVEVLCVTLPKDHCVQVPWKYIKVCGYSDLFCKKLEPEGSLTPRWPDPTSVEVTCVTLPKDHCIQVPWKYIKVCGYSDPFCKNLNQGHWPLDDLWPHICCGHMCDSTQGSLCPSPMGIHQCMWIQWSILQITKQRSLTHRWPLTPHLLRSYVWLCPRIIVSNSHENTSTYVDTVTFFAKKKKWTKGHGPLDDLWPHICCGHMCDSTQGSLCPSPMKIHQSMWIQWPFLQKLEPKVIDP